MRIRLPRALIALLLLLVAGHGWSDGHFCKWVDEHGVTHYAERCPDEVDASDVAVDEPPPAPAGQRRVYTGRDPDRDARNLSRQELRALGGLTRSRYLVTTSSLVTLDEEERGARFVLTLAPSDRLEPNMVLETRYPDPARPGAAVVERFTWPGMGLIRLESPVLKGFRCWGYHVVVSVLAQDASTLLDTHEQLAASFYDLEGIRRARDFDALLESGSNCPDRRAPARDVVDFEDLSPRQLRAECERQRDALLAPERARAIENCVQRQGKDRDYCERFYADYGDAYRSGDMMVPARYSNLPVCRAADAAEGRR